MYHTIIILRFETLEIIRLRDKINCRPRNVSILWQPQNPEILIKDTFLRILHACNLQHEKDLFSL